MAKSITSSLGIHGLKNLDPIILSALATDATTLLIGPHGSAKTLLAERVAKTLNCTFRHYNTSLLNYDDLVGYPVPDSDQKELHFIQTPGTIWDGEFVLFDEISRARPEIQNKIFPVVHEHRVQGIKLDRLKHCWAAMNPPCDGEDEHDLIYAGSWSLDVALADRFRFIMKVPGFNELSGKAQEEIMLNGDNGKQRTAFKTWIGSAQKKINDTPEDVKRWVISYLSSLIPMLEKADLAISGRRARFIFENILAIYAAECVLYTKTKLSDAALRAVMASLPHSASGKLVDKGKIMLAHRQAVQDADDGPDGILIQIRNIKDPVQRVEKALKEKLGKIELTKIVSDAFASLNTVHRYAWVQEVFSRISKNKRIGAVVLELLAEVAGKIHEGANCSFSESMNPKGRRWTCWQDLSKEIARYETEGNIAAEHVAVARALFFIEKKDISLSQVSQAFQNIEERILSCS